MAMTYARPATLLDLAIRLSDLGYMPVPIPAGCKGPSIAGWQNLRINFENADQYFTDSGQLVGILHTNVLALDVDVYDADLSKTIVDEAIRRFPGALERVGQAPKSALFFRMEEPGFKAHNTQKREILRDGKVVSAQVEVRSVTRQIVAYGRHPEAGTLYSWPRGELWATPWAELHLAEKADIEDFRDWCDQRINEWAGVAPQKVIDLGLPPRQDDGEKPGVNELQRALGHIPSAIPYDDWVVVLMGLHDYYSGSQEGLEAACQWSASYPDYSRKEVEQKWRSFEPGKGATHKTIFHLAKQYGADLGEIARSERPQQALAVPTIDPINQQAQPQQEIAVEWMEDIEPELGSPYLAKGILDQGAMSVVYGPSNSGKTFFALDLAYHIACGKEWRGSRIKQANVLYLAAEGGRGVLNRIAAIKRLGGPQDVPLALKRAGLDLLHDQADLQHICDLAESVKQRVEGAPLLIVIDTLSRVMAGGDENSAADMTALIRNVDAVRAKTNAHIMIVHHTGKDTARGARGHSSLRAGTDTEIEVQASENEEGELVRAAMVTKQRDHGGGETFAFCLNPVSLGFDEDGDEVASCVVEVADSAEFAAAQKAKKGLGGVQKLIADTFDQMLGEGLGRPNPGGVGMPEAGQFWAVSMGELKRLTRGKMTASDTRSSFNKAFAALSDNRGIFCAGENLVWRVDRRINK